MNTTRRHIPLHRQFLELGDEKSMEEAAVQSTVARYLGKSSGLDWDGIYRDGINCVILGEPGSGKTEESKQQVRNIVSKGGIALFVDLPMLKGGTPPDDWEKSDLLKRWRRDQSIAWFFLDPVDETKLQHVNDFERALKAMRRWVGADAARARYVINSRISEWRTTTDKRLVEEELIGEAVMVDESSDQKSDAMNCKGINRLTLWLGNQRVDSKKRTEIKAQRFRILSLLPLTRDQVSDYLLGIYGILEEAFFSAVNEADAWDFMGRPLDVDGLYALWLRKGRLGTRQEVIENSIDRMLDDPQSKITLSADRLRRGVEQLAACLAFSKNVSVVLDDAVLSNPQISLSLQNCLPNDWSDTERKQLVQLPIISAAAYGKVRFHHRTHQDYLAACWLVRLLREDCPWSEVRHLLFAERGGILTLRPALGAVAAWLTTANSYEIGWLRQHRQDVLNAAPWIFFAHGDPRLLPVEYKRGVLKSIVERFRDRDHVGINWDGPSLKRFADPALATDIARWISDTSISSDIRADYISLVEHGKMSDVLPSIVSVAIDPSLDEHLRATALVCLAESASLEQRQDIANAFLPLMRVQLRLGVWLPKILYPHVLDEGGLFDLIGRINVSKSKFRASSLYILDSFIEGIPSKQASAVLRELISFLRDEGQPIRESRAWGCHWLAPLVTTLLELKDLSSEERTVALDAFALIEEADERHLNDLGRNEDDRKVLIERTQEHPALRRAWFWRKVEGHRATKESDPSNPWDLCDYYSPLQFLKSDFGNWCADVRTRSEVRDRLVAMRMALSLCLDDRAKRPWLPPMSLVRSGLFEKPLRNELVNYVKFNQRRPFHLLYRGWRLHWSRTFYWRKLVNPAAEQYWNLHNRIHLWWGRQRLVRGEWWNGIWFVLDHARRGDSTSQWGSHDLSAPAKRFGSGVVQAAMVGADRVWRLHAPDLPHEKQPPNSTSHSTIFGLVALQAAWESAGASYFNALVSGEAEIAARYAMDELNGLPEWFGVLARAHPQPVGRVISAALTGEWRTTPSDAKHGGQVIQRLFYSDEIPENLYLPALQQLLLDEPPASTFLLHSALRLALKHRDVTAPWLAAHAANLLDDRNEIKDATWPWLLCLFNLDANRAMDFVKRQQSMMSVQEQDGICQTLSAGLFGEGHYGLIIDRPDFDRPEFLHQMIPWVYQHVRFEEDVVHDSAFTPGPRDYAERFRYSLISRLENHPNDEADAVLADLATDPSLRRTRDYLLMIIDRRRAGRADEFMVEPSDIHELLHSHERLPRNREDLFHTAWSRLQDFRESVESAENTIRHECQADWEESNYQAWITKKLQEKANDRYTVPREVEIDPGTFPDVRFESPHVDGAVNVEAKVATFDHWTYLKLEEGLRNQLVGQYLRAANAKYGVYLLFRAHPNRTWVAPDGTKLDWGGLISRLTSVAQHILAERQDLERLEVLGVDVTPPRNSTRDALRKAKPRNPIG